KGTVVGGKVGQAIGRSRLVLNLGGRAGHGQAGTRAQCDDVGVGELQHTAINVGAAGQRMGRAVKVGQAVGQIHLELGAAAYVEGAVIGEVARGGEVKAAGDGKGTAVGGEVGQAIGRSRLVLDLGGRARHGQAGAR